jgi:hypothetical protein
MRFVTITRRGGEAIPVNPELVCYMRQSGSLTTISMADGGSFRVEVAAAELVEAFSKGGGSVELKEPEKPPPESLAPQAPEALGASGAQITPAAPAGGPQPGDPDVDDEEDAKAQGAAQRAQEADPDEKPHQRAAQAPSRK